MTNPDPPPDTPAAARAQERLEHGRRWIDHLRAQLRGETQPAELSDHDRLEIEATR